MAYDREDAVGLKFGDELKRIGWVGEEEVGAREMHAFFELHIEQGPILEAEGKDIGVVTHGQGLNWLQVTLTGKEQHTGSTPMAMRRNAGWVAKVTQLAHEIAMSHQPNALGAVGQCDVYPNSRNIIPGRVVFTIDFARVPDAGRYGRAAAGTGHCRGTGAGVGSRDRRPLRSGDLR